MKTKKLFAGLLLSLAAGVAAAQTASVRTDLFGDPAPLTAAQRTIVITPDTRSVSVTGGEIVKFVIGEQSFAWHFDVALTVSSFELNLVAPSGLLKQKVIASVATDPMYRNP